jgi:isoleucyl-tRNA synthetase
VIETGRVIRERNNKPLKTPLRRLVVAHDDQDFLSDLQGELRAYVVEELNVLDMETCADPLKYATIKAEPNFAALGKRLGKAMGAVGKAVKGMSVADVQAFQKSGAFVVGDVTLGPEDILVKREFALPEGVTAEEMDAATGENEVMVIMDVVVDQGLLDSGSAREFVNRLQKLRKSSGLQATDAVEVFFEVKAAGEKDAAEGMMRMLESEKAYLRESLGCDPKPIAAMAGDARVVATGECSLSTGAEFVATLAALKI